MSNSRDQSPRGLLGAGLLLVAVCAFASDAALRGRVEDEVGRPLPGATVSVQGVSTGFAATTRTDMGGWYGFSELPDDEYCVEAGLPGFRPARFESVSVFFPSKTQRSFTLKVTDVGGDAVNPFAGYVQSVVVGELMNKGRRIPNGKICLTPTGVGKKPICARTSQLGEYFLSVEPGRYFVTVEIGGRLRSRHLIDLRTAGEYRNKIRLRR